MKMIRSLFALSMLALLLGAGATLNAQENKQQSPDQQTPPAQQAPPAQATPQPSDNAAQSQTPVGTARTFTGTIVKSGDSFVLQEDGGTTYDIDKQDLVKPFEGKKVNIKGTLDGKMIHMQQQ